MGWETIQPKGRGGRKPEDPDGVRLSRQKRGPKGGQGVSVRIRVGKHLANAYRLMIGDKVAVQFDWEARRGRIRRVIDEGGYQFSGAQGRKNYGKIMAGAVRPVLTEKEARRVFPNGGQSYDSPAAVVTPEGIEFDLLPIPLAPDD